MLRSPRPLLPSSLFDSAPAESWQAAFDDVDLANKPSLSQGPEDRRAAGENPLRDPRRENSVQNLELLPSEVRATSQGLAEEEFAASTPSRVEDVELQQLYLCELEEPEQLDIGQMNKPWQKGWLS